MADAVSDLNEFVKGSGVTHLQNNNKLMSENVVYAAWAVPIHKSTNLAKSPDESAALSIQQELNSIPQQDLNIWTPKQGLAYPSRSTVQQKIKSCMVHVKKLIDYCTAIRSVNSILGIRDCELSTELAILAFTKDTAFKICRGLGATLKRHLLYVNKAAVDGLGIKPNEKKTMWRITQEYQREYTDNNGVPLTPNAKALANMQDMIKHL
jgi:hypothetical protein